MQESVNEERPAKIFADVREVDITKAIAEEFFSVLKDRAESDVIIIGAGPAGGALRWREGRRRGPAQGLITNGAGALVACLHPGHGGLYRTGCGYSRA